MRNIKLTIEYDGTNYSGWQRQKNARTIQETLERSIAEITKENVELTGCSRTDAGVHAKGFVANFYTDSTVPEDKFKVAINSKLPKDIVILDSVQVNDEFHSRYNSKGKTYSYTILNRVNPMALGRNYVYHYKFPLNVDKMQKGAKYLLGEHDFTAFKSTGSSVKTSVRNIMGLDIVEDDKFIIIYASADGFLYNMVRIIVGTLIDVGINKIEPDAIFDILKTKDRTKAGVCVPAQGLCLEKVYY